MPTVKDLVKLLDLDVGEEFYIYDNYSKGQYNYVYKFSNHNLLYFENGTWSSSGRCILDFFTGRYTIVKRPWKPKMYEPYYYISSCGIIEDYQWTDDTVDLISYAAGNCFKTSKEAEAHIFMRKELHHAI